MAGKKITLDEVKTSINELLKQASDARASSLKQFAELQERRAKRLANAKARMEARLGKDDKRVVALERTASLADKFRQSLIKSAERKERRPRIKADEFLVFGRVLNEEGNPIPGLRVRFFTKGQGSAKGQRSAKVKRSRNDAFGVTVTDENGNFTLVFNKSSFADLGDSLPDLYLRIENPKGRLLYSSKDKVQFRAGRAEYFEIILVKKPRK